MPSALEARALSLRFVTLPPTNMDGRQKDLEGAAKWLIKNKGEQADRGGRARRAAHMNEGARCPRLKRKLEGLSGTLKVGRANHEGRAWGSGRAAGAVVGACA